MKITKETFETARAFVHARDQLSNRLVPEMIRSAGIIKTNKRLWELNTHFAALVRTGISNGHRAKHGIHEFVRQAIVGSPQSGMRPYDFVEVMQFLNSYKAMVGRVEKALGPYVEYHGDSFGDLCDSLPLMGAHMLKKVEAVRSYGDLDALHKKFGALNKDLFEGENYIRSTLEEKIMWFFTHCTHRISDINLEVETK